MYLSTWVFNEDTRDGKKAMERLQDWEERFT